MFMQLETSSGQPWSCTTAMYYSYVLIFEVWNGLLNWAQVWNRVFIITNFGLKYGAGFMVRAAQPHQTRCGTPSPPNRGSHVGEWAAAVVIALVCHQYVLALILSQHHMWVKFAVVSRLIPRVFLWVLMVSSLDKSQHLQIPIRSGQKTHMKTS